MAEFSPETETKERQVSLHPEMAPLVLLLSPLCRQWLASLHIISHLQTLCSGTRAQPTELTAAPSHTQLIAGIAIRRFVHKLCDLPPVGLSRVSYLQSKWLSPTPADEPEEQPCQDDEADTDDYEVFRPSHPHQYHL